MAVPTAGPYGSPTLDDFNRAGSTSPPSASWSGAFNTGNAHLALAADTATVKASTAGFDDDYWNVSTVGPDSEVWVCVATLATGTDELFALYARGAGFPSATTAYECSIAANALTTVAVARENSPSSFPPLGNVTLSASFAVNDALAMVVTGSGIITIEIWFWDDSAGTGWVKAGQVTDNFTITAPGSTAPFKAAGRIALEMQNTTGRITAFGGGTIVTTAASPVEYDALILWNELGPGDSFGPSPFFESYDTFGPSGTAWSLPLADSITLSDAVANSIGAPRADTLTLSDAVARAVVFVRSMTDTITLSDAVAKAINLLGADTITTSDASVKSVGANRSDTITTSDAFTRTATFSRSLADTVTLSDAVAKAVGLSKSDTTTLSDAAAKSVGLVKVDSITLSDAVAKTIGLGKSDTITLNDAVAKAMAHALADTITLSDSMTPSLGGGSGTAWTLNLADTITLADALHRTLTDAGATTATAAHARVVFLNRFGIY